MKKVFFTLLMLSMLFACSSDFKEPGFYLERDGRITKLSDPHKGPMLELDNLENNLVNLDKTSYKLYAYFPNFQELNLYFYTPEIWNIYAEMPKYSSNERKGRIYPAVVETSKNLFLVDYQDMPYEGIVAMAYYQTPADMELAVVAFDDFNTLIKDALTSGSVSLEKKSFAYTVQSLYRDRKDLVDSADKFIEKLPQTLERSLYLDAKNAKKDKERKLKAFIRDYPKSKYRDRAQTALNAVQNSKFNSRSSRSGRAEKPDNNFFLKKELIQLAGEYVRSVNTGNYARAKQLSTGRASSRLESYQRNKTILGSRDYGEMSTRSSGVKITSADGKNITSFKKLGNDWKVSSY